MIHDIERILRWEKLDKQHKMLRELTMKTCRAISKLETKCKHEIIIATATGIVPQAIKTTKCLFCGREDINIGYLGFNTKVIHSENSKLWLSHPAKYEVVKKLFIKIATDNPDMEAIEIAKKIQKEIDSESEEFIRASEEAYHDML